MFRLSSHHKRLTHLRREKAQTFTGSASTSARDACSSAASASQLRWPHQDRFKTLFAVFNVSTLSAVSLSEDTGLTSVHSGMHSSAHAVLWCSRTVMWGEESTAYLELNPPSLSSTRLLSLLLSMSLLSLVSFHFIPSSRPRFAPKWTPSASSCLPSVFMPLIVRFQQECERGRHGLKQDICECIYMGLRESLLWGQHQPPSAVKRVPERDREAARGQGDEKDRHGEAVLFHHCVDEWWVS